MIFAPKLITLNILQRQTPRRNGPLYFLYVAPVVHSTYQRSS